MVVHVLASSFLLVYNRPGIFHQIDQLSMGFQGGQCSSIPGAPVGGICGSKGALHSTLDHPGAHQYGHLWFQWVFLHFTVDLPGAPVGSNFGSVGTELLIPLE